MAAPPREQPTAPMRRAGAVRFSQASAARTSTDSRDPSVIAAPGVSPWSCRSMRRTENPWRVRSRPRDSIDERSPRPGCSSSTRGEPPPRSSHQPATECSGPGIVTTCAGNSPGNGTAWLAGLTRREPISHALMTPAPSAPTASAMTTDAWRPRKPATVTSLPLHAHPLDLRRPPRRARGETRPIAAERFSLRHDHGHRRFEVERLGVGLRRVPRRVHEQLAAIALGIREVDRPGVAVSDDPELLDALVLQPHVHGLEVFQRVELERDLVD